MRQNQNTNALGSASERSTNDVDVFPPGIVVVGQKNNVCATQKYCMFGFPLFCTASAARCRDIPRAKQVDLAFALDNKDRMICRDSFGQLPNPIWQYRNALDVPQPLAGAIWI